MLTPSNVKKSLLKTGADRTDYLERTDISELLELYKNALNGEEMDPDIAEGIY